MEENYTGIPKWDFEEIEEIANKHLMFLTYLFPFLTEKGYNKGVVEIRPICRLDEEDSIYVQSFNVFRVNNDTKERYVKFLEKINGKPYCLYYSLYSFDNKMELKGKIKNKINNENALSTAALAADFDNITVKKFEEIKEIFENLGLSTLDIFTGHGVQSIILLKENCYDTKLLKRFTSLLLRKGIPCDGALVDPARVLRMPFSYNCKAFDRNSKYFEFGEIPEGILTNVVNKPLLRYSVKYVFEKLEQLKDIVPILQNENEEIAYENEKMVTEKIETRAEKECKKEEKKQKKIEIKEFNESEVREAYKNLINVKKLPLSVLKMLNSTQEGLRNKVMLFLIPFLKGLGYTRADIAEIMVIWGSRCNPQINKNEVEREVKRLVKYDIKGYKYNEELAKTFGFIDFKLQRQNKVKIQKQITNNLDSVSDGAFRIFIAILNNKSINSEKKNYSVNEIVDLANITKKTFYNNIKDLIVNGILVKNTKVNKKSKESYVYYINPYISDFGGFALLERATIKVMLQELSAPELKLYTLMCSMLYNKENIFASQNYLSKKTGKHQTTISKIIKNLEDKKFITKKVEKIGIIEHLTYNLNY